MRGFVDGFNLYHAIDELQVPSLKWLDLRALLKTFVDPSKGESLGEVYYYSALAWDQAKANRHRVYIKALELRGVSPVLGSFAKAEKVCRATCRERYNFPSEKKTDVNLALGIALGAHRDEYDRAIVVTNDSDVIPALVEARACNKQIRILTPPGRRAHGEIITAAGSNFSVLTTDQLHKARLPDPVPAQQKGKTPAKCPAEWR